MSESTLAGARLVGRSRRVEPVAELERVRPESVGRDAQHGVDPVAHAGVLRAQHAIVAEALAQHPRGDRRGIAPRGHGGRAAEARQRGGHDERDVALVARLLEGEVAQPRREESVAVVEEARGRAEDLQVAGPPEALVALRAVGGDREEVAAHPPHDVLVQAIQLRVRGLEPAGAHHVGVQHEGLDVRRVELPGPAVELRVPEAVEREPRLERLGAVSGEVEVRFGCRVPQRSQRQLSLIQHLRVVHADARAGGTGHAQAQAADEVLAEIEHQGAGGRREHLGHGKRVDPAHGRRDARLGHRHVLVARPGRGAHAHGSPGGVVVSGRRPRRRRRGADPGARRRRFRMPRPGRSRRPASFRRSRSCATEPSSNSSRSWPRNDGWSP